MSKRSLVLVGTLFLTIVVGMIIFTTLVFSLAVEPIEEPVVPVSAPPQANRPAKGVSPATMNLHQSVVELNEPITLAREYRGGAHHLTGMLALPAPCYRLSTSTTVAESYPEQVTLSITVSTTNGESCPQVIDQQEIRFIASASDEALFAEEILLNGQPARLAIIPFQRTE